MESRVAGLVDFAHAARADPRRELIRADAPTLEALRRVGVFEQGSRRLQETLGACVRRQQRLHFLLQRLIAGAGPCQVRRARICR
jgi:hypothetical protein